MELLIVPVVLGLLAALPMLGSSESSGTSSEDLSGDGDQDPTEDETVADKDTDTEASIRIFALDDADWDQEVTAIDGPADGDTLTVGSGPVTVTDADGAGAVDLSAAEQALVYAGEGDSITGSDAADDLYDVVVTLSDDASFSGGAADEVVTVVQSDGAQAFGGGGNDMLVSDHSAALLDGGAGDDTIVGAGESWFAAVNYDSEGDLAETAADTLIGGAGDDRIIAGTNDVVSSGEGSDQVILTADGVQITDHDVSADLVTLSVDEDAADGSWADRITLQETEDGTRLSIDGVESAFFDNVFGLVVGVGDGDDENDTNTLISTEGEVADVSGPVSVWIRPAA